MKKLLVVLFVIATLVLALASCGECEHNFQEKEVIKAANCITDGKKLMECSECGETKEEVIPKNGIHDPEREEIEPTCKEPGKIITTCKVEGCDYRNESEGKKPTGVHTPTVEIVTEPTCTEDGEQKRVCAVCGDELLSFGTDFESTIPATGHTYENAPLEDNEELGVTIVKPNCDEDGYIARECKVCGYNEDPITLSELKAMDGVASTFIESMEKTGHNPEQFVSKVDPTCTEKGYTVYKCVNPGCDHEENLEPIDPLGHTYVKDETAVEGTHYNVTFQPTCIATGEKAYICTRCNVQSDLAEDKESIPCVPHRVVDDEAVCELVRHFEASCTTAEKKIFKCCVDPNCDYTEEFTFVEGVENGYSGPLGHDYQVSGEQTCLTGGKTPYTCARVANGIPCGDFKLDGPIADIPHVPETLVSNATCIHSAIYMCKVCETPFSVGDPTGEHKFEEVIQIIDPTCSSEGHKVYKCTADAECEELYGDQYGEVKAEDITPRIDHIFTSVTEDGKIICTVCRHEYRDVTTEVSSDSDSLCLGCGKEVCDCGLIVEWNGFVSPKAPFEITAGEDLVVSEVNWTVVEEKKVAIEIGGGIIVLNTKDGESAKFTVKLYSAVDGDAIAEITEEGSSVQIDLYKYESVVKVSISADADATVSLYEVAK